MYLAFFKWCFLKMFSGTFDRLASFRYQLKRGAPDSIFAIVGFILVAMLVVIAIVLISAGLFEDTNTVKNIGAGALYVAIFTLVYNIVKAAFECFLEERDRVFDELKR